MKFHTVYIIFNPNSTGDSELNAKKFKKQLKTAGYKGVITLKSTKFAGHAEELTQQYGSDSSVLIVSSSGDGGYNEIVNGLIINKGKAAVCVLPSGNANDHAVSVGSDNLAANVVKGNVQAIDCMKLESTVEGKSWTRYAHSYIGFGMTPSVGKVLTDKRPGALLEKWYVLAHIFSFKHTSLRRDGKKIRYANLVMATIPKMSKIVKLDEGSSVTDGKMEIYETRYISRIKLIFALVGIGIKGVASQASTTCVKVETVRSTLVQLDGEVSRLDSKVDVTVTCLTKALRTVL